MMNNLYTYFFQITIVFTVLYFFYRISLHKLTFYRLNRWTLLLLMPVSILLPLVDAVFPEIARPITAVSSELFSIDFEPQATAKILMEPTTRSTNNSYILLITIYWIGVFLYFLRFFLAKRNIVLLKQKATITKREGYSLAIAEVPQIFSYFHWIFIPVEQGQKENNIIIEHEKAHIHHKHSLDLIFLEIFIAFFWYLPVVYFYRKSLKSIHEFQADRFVLKSKVKKSDYMQLLLQSLDVQHPNNLYSYFTHPIIKKRIDMMTKSKSSNAAKLLYAPLLILCALLLVAFTKPTLKNHIENASVHILGIDKLPPSLFPVKDGSTKDISSHYGVTQKHPKLKKDKVHGGIDIRAALGTPVVATADGIITKAAMEGNWGNLIIIAHADGYETWYAHLKGFHTNQDQQVKKGDIIGYVGNTGLSTGPHLHYEVRYNGKRVNPMDYLGE